MSPFCSPAEAKAEDQAALALPPPHAEGATSVHPQHLSVPDLWQDTPDQQVRFQPYPEVRQWLLDHLWRLVPSARTRQRIRECGAAAWVEYSPSRHRVRIRGRTCGHRLCPACRARRAYLLGKRMSLLTEQAPTQSLKLITLTLKHSKRPLLEQIKSLKASFKRLRTKACWRRASPVGVAIVEVTRSEETGDWHPHLHILASCAFIPHAQLKAAWWSVTHSSNIVDIRQIKGRSQVARYVSTYLTKPPSAKVMHSPELSEQWSSALQNTHWVVPFGQRGALPQLPPDPHPNDWESIGTLSALANAGVPYRNAGFALSVLQATLNEAVIAFIEGEEPPADPFDL